MGIVLVLLLAGCAREPRHFGDLLAQVRAMAPEARTAAIEAYVARRGGTPLVDHQSKLVFLVREVDGITPRIVGDFNQWAARPAQPGGAAGYDEAIGTPTPIEGTPWSYLEGTAWSNARVEYVLVYGRKEARPDPLNPRLVQGFAGPRAEARMPLWAAQPEIDDRATVPAGRVAAESFPSRALGGSRRVWYYLPPGYDAAADTLYPTVYVLDGGTYIERMDVPRVLDRLIARQAIPPAIVVFSEPGERQEEYSRNPKWRAFVAGELVPAVDARFRTFPSPDRRAILGSSLAAYGAVDLAVEFPAVFGLCAALAPPAQTVTVIANQPKARAAAVSIGFFVLGGAYDPAIDAARRLRTTLVEAGAPVAYLEAPEGHSIETFRGHLDDALRALLPR